jgi:hypothetical protein
MTTIQTFEDILAAMRENPVLRAAMRQHVRDEEFNDRVLVDLSELKTDVAELKTGQARMEARQDRMEGQISNLTGTSYERKIAKRAARIVRRHLDIRNAELVYSLTNPEKPHLDNLLYQATEDRLISDEQANDLEDADLILLGRNPDGEAIYIVAEVSITVDDSDIDRAARRARALQTASGVVTVATVIGTAVSAANRQRAGADGVTYIPVAE